MLIILHWTFVKELSKLAIEALINLSQEPQLAEKIVRAGGIEKAMEFIGKLVTNLNRLLVMLIVNLTQSESGASRLLQVYKVDCIETTFRELCSIWSPFLLSRFLQGLGDWTIGRPICTQTCETFFQVTRGRFVLFANAWVYIQVHSMFSQFIDICFSVLIM